MEVECHTIAPTGIAAPGLGLDLLGPLYSLGESYHLGRDRVRRAHLRARGALNALDELEQAPLAGAWRAAVRELTSAADELEVAARDLDGLVGVTAVANGAREGAAALTAILRAGAADSEQAWDARIAWDDAESSLISLPERRAARDERLDEPVDARPSWSLRDDVGDDPSERERLLVTVGEGTLPNAIGAIGCESILDLSPPWSTVAWHAWRAAGRGLSWSQSWDTWPLLERFALATIGRARGLPGGNAHVADAVRAARKRATTY